MENDLPIIDSSILNKYMHFGKIAVDKDNSCIFKDIDKKYDFIYRNFCNENNIELKDDTKFIDVLLICTDTINDLQNDGFAMKDIDGLWYFASALKMIPEELLSRVDNNKKLKIILPMYLKHLDNSDVYKFFSINFTLYSEIA